MRKFIVVFLILTTGLLAQIPVFNNGNPHDGQACIVKIFSSTDTSYTGQVFWSPPYTLFTGAASLCGGFQLISGTDTVATIKVRLIMRIKSALTGEGGTVVYDSSGYHTLTTGGGNYIPAENAVTTTYTPFSVDLAGEAWWKPCIGIEVQIIENALFGTATKEVECYLIPSRYNY